MLERFTRKAVDSAKDILKDESRKMLPTWFGIAGALLMVGILVGDKPKEPVTVVNVYIKEIQL